MHEQPGRTQSVVIFTLASVQEFVACARRTQDAWMGSFLFAHLMAQALRTFDPSEHVCPRREGQPLLEHDPNGPSSDDKLRIASITNVATVRVAQSTVQKRMDQAWQAIGNEAGRCALAVRAYVETAVCNAAAAAAKAVIADDRAWSNVWQRQQEDWLRGDWFWASALIGSPYEEAARTAAGILEARKLCRDFQQFPEEGHKCSLCGIRTALGPQDSRPNLRQFWETLAKIDRVGSTHAPKLLGRIRPSERLCAICLTKRLVLEVWLDGKSWAAKDGKAFGEPQVRSPCYSIDRHQFPSTAEIAAAEWKLRVGELDDALKNGINQQAASIADNLRKAGIDRWEGNAPPALAYLRANLKSFVDLEADWLYEKAWNWDRVKSEQPVEGAREQHFNAANEAFKALRRTLPKEIRKEPTPYYALVAADGDHLGDLLNKLPEAELNQLVEALLRFSTQRAPCAVEALGLGRLIFAGGDDLLAFVPLAKLLTVMEGVRTAFAEAVRQSDTDATPMTTLSLAALVKHETEPLRPALEEVNRLLKHEAKIRAGRNAFCLAIEKRSGSPVMVTLPWELNEQSERPVPVIPRLEQLQRGFEGSLSPGVITDVRRLLPSVRGMWRPGNPDPGVTLMREWRRLVRRHCQAPDVADPVVTAGEELMTALICERNQQENTKPRVVREVMHRLDPWEQLLRLLEIARFLARE